MLQFIHKRPNVTNIEFVQIFKIYKQYSNANPPPVPYLIMTVYDISYDSKRP